MSQIRESQTLQGMAKQADIGSSPTENISVDIITINVKLVKLTMRLLELFQKRNTFGEIFEQ